jgi:hypothetical protein
VRDAEAVVNAADTAGAAWPTRFALGAAAALRRLAEQRHE